MNVSLGSSIFQNVAICVQLRRSLPYIDTTILQSKMISMAIETPEPVALLQPPRRCIAKFEMEWDQKVYNWLRDRFLNTDLLDMSIWVKGTRTARRSFTIDTLIETTHPTHTAIIICIGVVGFLNLNGKLNAC